MRDSHRPSRLLTGCFLALVSLETHLKEGECLRALKTYKAASAASLPPLIQISLLRF
jgi:hypothetical protein